MAEIDFGSVNLTRPREAVAAGPSNQVPRAVVGRVVDGRTSLPGLGTGMAAYASALKPQVRLLSGCRVPLGVRNG